MKGLPADIFTSNRGDCSNGGLSSRVTEVILVGPTADEIFEATPERPAVVLKSRQFGERVHVFAVPYDLRDRHTMFGGTFIYSSDSRFPSRHPIPLHDRVE